MFSAPTWSREESRTRTFFCSPRANWACAPDECLVIEDSAGGIRAAVAAGMTVVGLCAASHIREGHDLKLRDAGAVHLALSWSDVESFALHFFNG